MGKQNRQYKVILMRSDNKAKKRSTLGRLITAAIFIMTLIFDYLLISCRMVPEEYLVPVVVLLLLLTLMIGLLTRQRRKKARFGVGILLSLAVGAVLIYGIMALARLTGVLDSITAARTEVTDVAVYVLAEDDAETLDDLAEDTFGVLANLDRTATDSTIEQLNEDLNTEIATADYYGLTSLIDALYARDCGAILLNTAYLDVLEEMEGYEDIADRIREITVLKIKEKVVSTTDGAVSETAFVVYISGVDSRNGLSAKSRSDVNILAVVNTETHQVLLVSTPRDYYVELSISDGAKDKLTHAGIYGVNVSMDTLAMLYDIDVDYYCRLCFEGFEELVDALDGVEVYSEYAFHSSYGDFDFVEGYNSVNGEQALWFARERYAFSSGDRQRGKNQMELIKAIIKKAISPEILVTYGSLLDAMEDNFETSVPYDLIASLVSDQLRNASEWSIISYSVDGTGSSQIPWSMSVSAYVMIPDEETISEARELMRAVLNGEIIEQPRKTEDIPDRKASNEAYHSRPGRPGDVILKQAQDHYNEIKKIAEDL
ncbi:MAG: LCP family protein [Lachnospiraceae bacterium]|nr:LCP family protein [Lachnospiraceae bacterium]